MIKVIKQKTANCKIKDCPSGLFYFNNKIYYKLNRKNECYIVDETPDIFYCLNILCINIKEDNYIDNGVIPINGIVSDEIRDDIEVTPIKLLDYYNNINTITRVLVKEVAFSQ